MHEIEPAVAQTELPPIPDDLKAVYAVVNVQHMDEDWFCNYSFVRGLIERIASLTQRLQEKEAQTELPPQESWKASYFWMRDQRDVAEAREAELKAQLKDVLDRESASAKLHDDRMEALERSHKALLDVAWNMSAFAVGNCDVCEIIARRLRAAAAAAEEL